MTEFIATFHTHLSAMRSQKSLSSAGVAARIASVPRYLSASCGTCVIYTANESHLDKIDSDVERVVERPGPRGAVREWLRND
jgi:hypothetical protein